MVLRERIELSASPLPRECSPAELCALRLRGALWGADTVGFHKISCKMSSTMLSASLASVEGYDAFSLSPMTAARVLASRRTSVSRISRAIASGVFALRMPCGSGCLAGANMRNAPRCGDAVGTMALFQRRY
jgi:hypothetical protein